MPNRPFEVASPFEDAEVAESAIDALIDESPDAEEINLRRAQAEHAENLRLARAL
ncbi:hypothetical protein [Phenylobacterium sp.]|uniref:hypothetical protein n=1 Tax=Phenylobacterium sp. TaxID=1871053 RepID=UPI00289FAFD2|nr:hypothetical protein [Phenylobacterium sp.]